MIRNVYKDVNEFKECYDNLINLWRLKKSLKNYKLKYWNFETNKWSLLFWYYKSIYSNNYVSIEEYFNKRLIKKSKKKVKRKQIKEKSISNYKIYINSSKWKKKRLSFIKKYKNKCQCCWWEFLDKDLSLHHHTYQRVWKELDNDLALVCINCHNLIHYKNWKKVKLQEKYLRERFKEIKLN